MLRRDEAHKEAGSRPATHDLRTFKAAPKMKRKPTSKQKQLDME